MNITFTNCTATDNAGYGFNLGDFAPARKFADEPTIELINGSRRLVFPSCRNCGAPSEDAHPHACGYCLTPRFREWK